MAINLVNQKVKHFKLGIGTVVEQTATYIVVQFENKTSKFIFPDAFKKFLNLDDTETQKEIISNIAAAKNSGRNKKEVVDPVCCGAQKNINKQEYTINKERNFCFNNPPLGRESANNKVFFVFQGSTYAQESRGGYIWAPITNKSGSSVHHWNRLLEVRAGDIILHGCDGYIKAISIARDSCYECNQPNDFQEDLWEREGRRVDCDYVELRHPIKTIAYRDSIVKTAGVKYSPFKSDGTGNMGYLFEINRELAHLFVSESVQYNSYLLEVAFIKAFLNENKNMISK